MDPHDIRSEGGTGAQGHGPQKTYLDVSIKFREEMSSQRK